jgi:two-component system, NarL family, response regulator
MDERRPKKKIRILIADDHPVVRSGLVALLDREPDMEVVAEAANGREAIERFRDTRPDLALIDLRMPVLDGVEAIRLILAELPASRVVVLTTYDGDANIRRALTAGARGYLLKDLTAAELAAAVRRVEAGQRLVAPAAAARLAEHAGDPELTARELTVLELVVKGKSNKRIGAALGITEGTVKGHVNNILSKMHVDDRTQAAGEALRRGLVHLE